MASVREKNDIGLTTSAIINDRVLSVQSKADNCPEPFLFGSGIQASRPNKAMLRKKMQFLRQAAL